MRIRKGGKLIGAILALFCIVTIVWLSCTKVGTNPNTCNGVVCDNGAFCHVDTITKKPKCICPTGFEGPNCGTAQVDKYVGTWKMMQIIAGSDSLGFVKDTSYYTVNLTKTATPTTFFITNLSGNPYYNNIICTMDSANSYVFIIDTISAYHMLFDHYHMMYGFGYVTSNDTFIRADLGTRHLSATSNWINDTLQLWLTRP